MSANAAKPMHQMSGRISGSSVGSRDRPMRPELMSWRKPERGTRGLRRRNEHGRCRSEKNKFFHDSPPCALFHRNARSRLLFRQASQREPEKWAKMIKFR
jgi:hypothetical protein